MQVVDFEIPFRMEEVCKYYFEEDVSRFTSLEQRLSHEKTIPTVTFNDYCHPSYLRYLNPQIFEVYTLGFSILIALLLL